MTLIYRAFDNFKDYFRTPLDIMTENFSEIFKAIEKDPSKEWYGEGFSDFIKKNIYTGLFPAISVPKTDKDQHACGYLCNKKIRIYSYCWQSKDLQQIGSSGTLEKQEKINDLEIALRHTAELWKGFMQGIKWPILEGSLYAACHNLENTFEKETEQEKEKVIDLYNRLSIVIAALKSDHYPRFKLLFERFFYDCLGDWEKLEHFFNIANCEFHMEEFLPYGLIDSLAYRKNFGPHSEKIGSEIEEWITKLVSRQVPSRVLFRAIEAVVAHLNRDRSQEMIKNNMWAETGNVIQALEMKFAGMPDYRHKSLLMQADQMHLAWRNSLHPGSILKWIEYSVNTTNEIEYLCHEVSLGKQVGQKDVPAHENVHEYYELARYRICRCPIKDMGEHADLEQFLGSYEGVWEENNDCGNFLVWIPYNQAVTYVRKTFKDNDDKIPAGKPVQVSGKEFQMIDLPLPRFKLFTSRWCLVERCVPLFNEDWAQNKFLQEYVETFVDWFSKLAKSDYLPLLLDVNMIMARSQDLLIEERNGFKKKRKDLVSSKTNYIQPFALDKLENFIFKIATFSSHKSFSSYLNSENSGKASKDNELFIHYLKESGLSLRLESRFIRKCMSNFLLNPPDENGWPENEIVNPCWHGIKDKEKVIALAIKTRKELRDCFEGIESYLEANGMFPSKDLLKKQIYEVYEKTCGATKLYPNLRELVLHLYYEKAS